MEFRSSLSLKHPNIFDNIVVLGDFIDVKALLANSLHIHQLKTFGIQFTHIDRMQLKQWIIA